MLLPHSLVLGLLQPEPTPFAGCESHWSGHSVHPILPVLQVTFLQDLWDCLEAKKVAYALAKYAGLMVSCRAGVAPALGRAGGGGAACPAPPCSCPMQSPSGYMDVMISCLLLNSTFRIREDSGSITYTYFTA